MTLVRSYLEVKLVMFFVFFCMLCFPVEKLMLN